jgi:hypothetical protein
MSETVHLPRNYDPLEYVRNYYKVPAVVGRVVMVKDRRGVITGASGPHVKVWLDGDKTDFPYHPSDLTYTGEVGSPPKLTRSQRNYRAWLHAETSESFIEFMQNPFWDDYRRRH